MRRRADPGAYDCHLFVGRVARGIALEVSPRSVWQPLADQRVVGARVFHFDVRVELEAAEIGSRRIEALCALVSSIKGLNHRRGHRILLSMPPPREAAGGILGRVSIARGGGGTQGRPSAPGACRVS